MTSPAGESSARSNFVRLCQNMQFPAERRGAGAGRQEMLGDIRHEGRLLPGKVRLP